jgi:diacylglycerol kinase family enzyme
MGIGFDAHVAQLNLSDKKLSGILSYLLAVLRGLKNMKYLVAEIHTEKGKFQHHNPILLITIGNGRTSGGGFYLTPDALIDDGLFDITVIRSISKFKLLRKLPLALMNKLKSVPEAEMCRGKVISINLDFPYYVHVDGEILSDKTIELNIEIIPKKLKFIT